MSRIENLEQTFSLKKIDNETINIKIHNNEILISLVGEFNKNLNELEKLTKTKIFFRGNFKPTFINIKFKHVLLQYRIYHCLNNKPEPENVPINGSQHGTMDTQ